MKPAIPRQNDLPSVAQGAFLWALCLHGILMVLAILRGVSLPLHVIQPLFLATWFFRAWLCVVGKEQWFSPTIITVSWLFYYFIRPEV